MTKTGQVIRIILFTLVVLISLGAAVYYAYRYYDLKQNPEKLTEQSVAALKDRVGKLILLPNETPQIAVVQDVDKLKKDQPFFANAQNGDQILLFTEAKKAILYRSGSNQIIEVGPLLDKPADEQSTNQQPFGSSLESTSPSTSNPTIPPPITPVDNPTKAR